MNNMKIYIGNGQDPYYVTHGQEELVLAAVKAKRDVNLSGCTIKYDTITFVGWEEE